MKVVILAGGFGTRISEESHLKPKPMIEIGEKPILWHIMKYYSAVTDSMILSSVCGYKQYVVKECFRGLLSCTRRDVTFDLANNKMEVHNNYSEPWKVTLVDTGLNTMTGGRIKRIRVLCAGGDLHADLRRRGVQTWIWTLCVKFHKSHGKIGHHHHGEHRPDEGRAGH